MSTFTAPWMISSLINWFPFVKRTTFHIPTSLFSPNQDRKDLNPFISTTRPYLKGEVPWDQKLTCEWSCCSWRTPWGEPSINLSAPMSPTRTSTRLSSWSVKLRIWKHVQKCTMKLLPASDANVLKQVTHLESFQALKLRFLGLQNI